MSLYRYLSLVSVWPPSVAVCAWLAGRFVADVTSTLHRQTLETQVYTFDRPFLRRTVDHTDATVGSTPLLSCDFVRIHTLGFGRMEGDMPWRRGLGVGEDDSFVLKRGDGDYERRTLETVSHSSIEQ